MLSLRASPLLRCADMRFLGSVTHPAARACYVLETARSPGAVEPLLAILIRCCQAGKDVADQVRSEQICSLSLSGCACDLLLPGLARRAP